MALLDILEFPDSRLRTKAKPVTDFDPALKTLCADLIETMYEANGIGLAATQVNIHRKIIVLDVSEEQDDAQVIINPTIVQVGEEDQEYEEGCLSVPGFKELVQRPGQICIEAKDIQGKSFKLECDGILAVCVQHEMDHLEGKLFVDYLSSLKRNRIKKKLEKAHKLDAS